MLSLRLRLEVTNERWTNRLAAPFAFLFRPWIVAPMVIAFVAVVVWVVGSRGLGASARQLLYSPGLLLGTFVLLALSASFHELGHAAGCRYSGGRPGAMGCGLYLVWPAFYTDVTDAYRLDRAGRPRIDLGGLYFNAIFAVGTFAVWAATGIEALLVLIPLQVLQMHQLLPFVRLDGYHILSDLVGVPDLFARIKPTLLALRPGRRNRDDACVVKPWVRVVVGMWVLTVVPLLGFALLMVVITAPRMVATAWDSVGLQWHGVGHAYTDGRWPAALAGVVGAEAVVLPVLGSGYAVTASGARPGCGRGQEPATSALAGRRWPSSPPPPPGWRSRGGRTASTGPSSPENGGRPAKPSPQCRRSRRAGQVSPKSVRPSWAVRRPGRGS